jgi:hypothetical protein
LCRFGFGKAVPGRGAASAWVLAFRTHGIPVSPAPSSARGSGGGGASSGAYGGGCGGHGGGPGVGAGVGGCYIREDGEDVVERVARFPIQQLTIPCTRSQRAVRRPPQGRFDALPREANAANRASVMLAIHWSAVIAPCEHGVGLTVAGVGYQAVLLPDTQNTWPFLLKIDFCLLWCTPPPPRTSRHIPHVLLPWVV